MKTDEVVIQGLMLADEWEARGPQRMDHSLCLAVFQIPGFLRWNVLQDDAESTDLQSFVHRGLLSVWLVTA